MHRSDKIYLLYLSIIVGKFVVSEIVIDVRDSDELHGGQITDLTVIVTVAQHDSGHENLFFFRT